MRVFRYDSDVEAKRESRFDEFHVPYETATSVLDAPMYARDQYDSSLTFRHSCRMGVCGSDGLFINGRQRPGYQTQVADLQEPIRVEPLPHEPVIKDFVVDRSHFYDRMGSIEPHFQPDELPEDEHTEQRQSPEDREKIKKVARCIQCGYCPSSCNPAQSDERYIGPVAIVNGYRLHFDQRKGNDIKEHLLDALSEEHGVWQCHTQFS